MKKISAFFLALALCLGLAVPAFAADGGAYPTFKAPENSGTIFQAQTMAIKFVGFARSGNNNTHIFYDTYQDYGNGGSVRLAPRGVDIVVTGVKSADEIRLCAFTAANLEDGPFEEGQFKDLPGGEYLFYRLFVQESGKDISLVPLNVDDPMEFEYDDPKDGKTLVAGNITAADAGFQVNGDGDVVLNSERLYELLDEGDLLQVIVGKSFWLYRLSGEPLLVSDVFTDVDTGKWVSDPVAWALMSDITNGTAEDKFSPEQNCTQAQILTFLYRAAREEQVESSSEDMELAVQWAREKGMIDDNLTVVRPAPAQPPSATFGKHLTSLTHRPAALPMFPPMPPMAMRWIGRLKRA